MAAVMERMLSVLHTPEEGQGAEKGTPVLDGSKPFKHYRRKKTNKAPRKRAFIASMTRQPSILTDALASSARGTGQGVDGLPPPASLTNPGPSAGSVPAQADSQVQQQIADAGLRSLPVMYQPVVFGSKHAPPTTTTTMPAAQPYFYDADLAAALAEYQPPSQPLTSFASSAFRAVTTTLDQLPPSTMARSICTGLETAEAPVPRKAAPAAAPVKVQAKQASAPGAAAAMPAATAQAHGQLMKPSQASSAALLAMGNEAMMSNAMASVGSGHSHQSWAQMQMQGSITSPLIPGPAISGMPAAMAKQPLRCSQPSGSSGMSANELVRMASSHSSRSSGTPVASGEDVFQGNGMMQGAPMLPLGFAAAVAMKTEAGMSLQQQVVAAAASPPLLVLPLDPAGWSKLPPRAPIALGKRAWGGEDEGLLYNPNRVACHTLLDTGAYGAVYRGSLQSDEEGEGSALSGPLRPSLFAEVAVKLLRPGQAQATPEAQAQVLRSFQVEAELLPSLSHPNVVPVWYVNADPAAGAVCLVQELATLGTLADYIHGRPRGGITSVAGQAAVLAHRQQVEGAVLGRVATQLGLPAPVLLQRLGGEGPGLAAERRRRLVLLCLLHDVAMALSYLASLPQPVVHRDVKPANVLISAQGKALLADFGVAKLMPGAVSQGSDWDAFQPAAKRARTCSSDGTSGWTSHSQSPSPALPPPAGPWSPAPSSEEETDWMEALMNEDLPMASAHAMSAAGPAVDADSLGWLHELLGQDNDELLGLHAAPAANAAAPASPALSASAGGSSSHMQQPAWAGSSEAATGAGAWGATDAAAVQHVPSALDHDLQGTAHYAAPEDLMAGGGASTYALSPAADVFSLGYCIWEALSAQRPWAGMRAAALATSVGTKGARLPVNRGWALPLQGLLRRSWQADPAARPTAEEVAGTLEAEMRAIVAM